MTSRSPVWNPPQSEAEPGHTRDFLFPPLHEEEGADTRSILALVVGEALGASDRVLEAALTQGENLGALDKFFIMPLTVGEVEGGAEKLLPHIATSEGEGAAEKLLPLTLNYGEGAGGADALAPIPVAKEDVGASEFLKLLDLSSLGEGEGHDPLEIVRLEGLQEGGGFADASGAHTFTPKENEGHADRVLTIEAFRLGEGEGHDARTIPILTTREDGGHQDNRHFFTATVEVDADTYISESALEVDSGFGATDPLLIDNPTPTRRMTFLKFRLDFLKPVSRTFNATAGGTPRRNYGESAIWNMDADDDEQPSAGKTRDRGGRAFDLTKNGNVALVDGPKAGWKGYSFDGTGDYLSLAAGVSLSKILAFNYGYEWAIAFWFKKNGNPAAEQVVMSNKTDDAIASGGWALVLTTAGRLEARLSDGVSQLQTASDGTTNLTNDVWHRVVVRREMTAAKTATISFHVDNVANGSATNGGALDPVLPTTQDIFRVGRYNGGTSEFVGSLSKLRFYDYGNMPAADLDAVLNDPFEARVGEMTVTAATLLVNVEDSEVGATNVDVMIIGKWPSTVTWNKRTVNHSDELSSAEQRKNVNMPAAAGAFTVNLDGAAVLDRIRKEAPTGELYIAIHTRTLANPARQISSKEDATVANRPRLEVQFERVNT